MSEIPQGINAAPGTPPPVVVERRARKPWWKSRTLWFNALCAAMAALEAGTGFLAQIFSPAVYPKIAIAVAVINAVLRVVTAQRIALK